VVFVVWYWHQSRRILSFNQKVFYAGEDGWSERYASVFFMTRNLYKFTGFWIRGEIRGSQNIRILSGQCPFCSGVLNLWHFICFFNHYQFFVTQIVISMLSSDKKSQSLYWILNMLLSQMFKYLPCSSRYTKPNTISHLVFLLIFYICPISSF